MTAISLPSLEYHYSFIPPYVSDKLLDFYSKENNTFEYRKQRISNLASKEARILTSIPTGIVPTACHSSNVPITILKFAKLEVWNAFRGLPQEIFISEDESSLIPEALACYKNMRLTDEFFISKFETTVLRNSTKPLRAYINHPKAYNNAFWSPITESIYIGEVDPRLFNSSLNSTDIIAHEFGHAFTERVANLKYYQESGALNESMSDVIGSMVNQYKHNTNADTANWLIGDGLLVNKPENGRALRSMAMPGSAYRNHPLIGNDPQPKHMHNYVRTNEDCGGVHINSGIPNHAYYLAARGIGGFPWEKTGKIWIKTLLTAQQKDNFVVFAHRSILIAKDYGDGVVNLVGKAWRDVGVDLRKPSIPNSLPSKL